MKIPPSLTHCRLQARDTIVVRMRRAAWITVLVAFLAPWAGATAQQRCSGAGCPAYAGRPALGSECSSESRATSRQRRARMGVCQRGFFEHAKWARPRIDAGRASDFIPKRLPIRPQRWGDLDRTWADHLSTRRVPLDHGACPRRGTPCASVSTEPRLRTWPPRLGRSIRWAQPTTVSTGPRVEPLVGFMINLLERGCPPHFRHPGGPFVGLAF